MRQLKHKFHAKRCEVDGKKFPSQLEKNCYLRLKSHQEKGTILFFLRQVPIDLPGNTKHIVDFLIFTPKTVIFLECKGRDLPMGKLKRTQAEELLNIKISLAFKPSDIDLILLDKNL